MDILCDRLYNKTHQKTSWFLPNNFDIRFYCPKSRRLCYTFESFADIL